LKASFNWLKEFVDFSLAPHDLAHAMTMAGFEVEGISKIDNDAIFDVNITPNRPDCLSIIGLSREISAILEIPLKRITVELQKQEGRGPDVEVQDNKLCRRYSSRTIRGVKSASSPDWLKKRLESHGIRTSCSIVDITNYVLMEMGQPLHAFDLDKLSGQKISVKTAGTEKYFRTLDGENRSLSKDVLLIWDAEKPVALAGIMGGLDSEVSSSSTNILLESACFDAVSIRRASKSLNAASESSYRFERGTDIDNVVLALDRAAQMIAELAGGTISGLTDVYSGPFMPKQIFISFDKITSLIGIKIDELHSSRILNNLGFNIRREGEGIVATPPAFRQDIQRDVDIIEEIARLYGYGHIPATLPCIKMCPTPANRKEHIIDIINNSMSKSGFSEVINYSFISPDSLDSLNISLSDERRLLIKIKNPLKKEEAAMRTTLLPSLLNNVNLNFNKGEKSIRFYEISRVFIGSGEKLPREKLQMAAIYHKDESLSLWPDKHDGFYDLKGVLEAILAELRIYNCHFNTVADQIQPYLHPGKSCSLSLNGETIGSLGTLHPLILEAFDIKGDISMLEIFDVDGLSDKTDFKLSYKSIPKFPFIVRDIAVIVSRDIPFQQVRDEILSASSNIIESVNLFDIYTGKPIPDDKKSLAFSIRYRSHDRTLTDEEVDSLHSSIVEKMKTSLNADLRS